MSSSVYKKLALEGLKWSYLQQFFVLAINYGTLLILANLIEPKIHGAVVLASLPTGLTGVLGTMGVREKILKETSISAEKFKELMGLVIGMSSIVTLLTIIVSVVISFIYAKQFSFGLLLKLGLSLAIISPLGIFNNYFEALQSRRLKFKKQNILSIFGIAIGCILAIIAAYTHLSYTALVIKLVVPNLVIFIGYVFFIKVDFKFIWARSILIELKDFITYFSLNSIFNYLVRNVDYLIIGKFFSGDVLGQYSIAYKILLFPMRTVTSKVNAVLLPILARIDANTKNFKQKYFLVITVLSFLIFPMMGFISLTSDLWVPVLFNSNYNLLARMISVLAVVGMLQALVSPVGTLFLLKENLKLMLRNSIIVLIVVSGSYLVSSIYFNIYGVVTSFALIWIFLLMPITLTAAFKPYKYRLFDFLKSIMPAFFSLIITGAIAFYITYFTGLDTILKIMLSFISLSMGYIILYHLLTRRSKINLPYLINLARG
jgi:PST family polysaccharide transporter